jgi:hypothetical protein
MRHFSRTAARLLVSAAGLLFPAMGLGQGPSSANPAQPPQVHTAHGSTPQVQVRRVQVLHNRDLVEIEIQASDRIVPQMQVLTGPDRLVVDFANAVPGAQLRNQAVNRGEVKDVRVSLFAARPPVTRVVLDLNGPQHCQVFPYGRTVIVKVGGGASAESAALNPAASASKPMAKLSSAVSSGPVLAGTGAAGTGAAGSGVAPQANLANATYSEQPVHISAPAPPAEPPPLKVSFQGGLLSINSNKASLSAILFAVHQRTGADIPIPAGAEQEQVVANLGPAPAPEVLAHLLNGSKFNFLILSSSTTPGALDRVILSPRTEALMPLPLPQTPATPTRPQLPPEEETEATPPPEPPAAAPNPTQPPPTPPEARAPQSNDVPD